MFRSAIAALLCLATPALSFEMPNDLARAEFMPGWRDGNTHVAGLTIKMAPGWKTYWRAPGEGGIPPRFNWSGSSNVTNVEVRFPVPKVYNQNGLQSIGYSDQVTFPLVITTRNGSAPVSIEGEINIGVCEEICVPVTLKLSTTLPAVGSHDRGLAALLKNRPETGGGLACEITPIADGLRMTAVATIQQMPGEEIAVIEIGDPEVWVSSPKLVRKGGKLSAEVEMVAPTAKPFALARSDVRMTVLAGGRAIEMLGC
ncbi:protein-disulfide reductase DsbD family protein [Rhodobacteraceae bacterium]|nr:protein-disulfide reductase DsbD family protein [Paracoccaceae bacterium]